MFEEFLANEQLKKEMEGLLESGSLPHAVAICGKSGCGTGCFAKLLAAAYLGDTRGRVRNGTHPDFLEISGEGLSGEIRIDTVRENLYEMNMASVLTEDRRVVYIRHAEDLNDSSSNALLKAIEEPVPGVMFLLTVSDPNLLLPTIRSRVAVYQVLPLPEDLCWQETLKRVPGCKPEEAKKLARVFGGRLGLCLGVLEGREEAEGYRYASGFCKAAMAGKKYDALVWAAGRIASREQYRDFLEMSSLYAGYLLRTDPGSAARLKRLSGAIDEAYGTANSVNLKLSATRLALASI